MRGRFTESSPASLFPPFRTTNGSPLATESLRERLRRACVLDCVHHPLLVILLVGIVDDVEELELVHSLRGRDDAEPVTELHLLEELLGQVLEVTAGQLVVGNDLNLAVALLGDLNGLAEVADATLNLDLLVQELLEGGDIEDLVARRLRSVDDELLGSLGRLALLL